MTDGIIDGRMASRQLVLQMLRDVCTEAAALSGRDLIRSGQWQDRAKAAIKSCTSLQRGVMKSHARLADELHFLATEIQIALAAQSDDALFAARIEKVLAASRRVQQSGSRPDTSGDGTTA